MTDQGFEFNGESNLDLQYAMALVTASQPVTLYQVGDLEIGASTFRTPHTHLLTPTV
jgi:tripeptidyl-peptidase-1